MVEPELEPVEIALGVGLVALSVLDRKVGVDAIGRLPRLVHHHGRECHDRQTDSSGKAQVDDRHGEPTRNPHAPEPAHERVQEQRDERSDEEEEDDVTRRPRDHPDQEQQDREPDELNPARDLDPRHPAGHGSHRSASVVRLRPPPWDWSAFEDGALALDPLPAEVPRALHGDVTWVTVAVMPPRPAGKSSPARGRRPPHASRRPRPRPKRRTARGARRFVGLVVLSVIAVVTTLLTAFGDGRSPSVDSVLAPPTGLVAASPPRPQIVATAGTLRLQLPVSQRSVTAIGYHGAADGAIALDPVGRQGNQGFVTRLFHRIFGGNHGGLVYYRLGGSGTATGALDIGAAPGTDVYAPVDGTITGLTDYVVNGRKLGVPIDVQPTNAPSMVVSLTHVRADPALTVGSAVVAATSKIGTVIDLSSVEREALARYTRDAGNHVSLEVHQAASLASP